MLKYKELGSITGRHAMRNEHRTMKCTGHAWHEPQHSQRALQQLRDFLRALATGR